MPGRLLTRRWIVMTILAATAVAVMVELGFWQLRRLHSVRAENARIRASMAQPAMSKRPSPVEIAPKAKQPDGS